MKSTILTRDQVPDLWSRDTDSKTLDYQRTNCREYPTVRTHKRKPLEYKTWHHPTIILCRTPHPNNRQDKNTNSVISIQITTSLSLALQMKNKQTKTQHKSHPIQAYTNHWTNLRRAETKRKKEFNLESWEKETSYTTNLKNIQATPTAQLQKNK